MLLITISDETAENTSPGKMISTHNIVMGENDRRVVGETDRQTDGQMENLKT